MQSILFSQKNNILVHFMSLHTIKVEKRYNAYSKQLEVMLSGLKYYGYEIISLTVY